MSEDIRQLTISTLKKIVGDFDENSLEIKFYEVFKDRYDIYGKFQNSDGFYEFAISVDNKGKIKRNHVNLIMPRKVKDEIEKKVHRE